MGTKIYICGPVGGQVGFKPEKELASFVSIRRKIHKDLNAHVEWPEMDTPVYFGLDQPNSKNLKESIKRMINCSHVVTLEGWAEDSDCIKEIEIARCLGIEVHHFTALNKIK